MQLDYSILGAFVVYLAVMLGIGFVFSKKANSLSAYFLGGRQMNKWVVALSAQASDMSGWLLMGLPGAIFVGGFSEVWIGIGLVIGTYLNWKIVARRLRVYSHLCGDSITIPDFFANRFRDKTGIVRWIAALVILVFFTPYVASGFVSAAKLLTTTFGLGYQTSLWIGAAVVLGYTLLGGYMAVCWTDFIQGSLMFIAIVLVPAMVLTAAGGFTASVNQMNAVSPYLLNLFSNAGTKEAMGGVALVSNLAWGLGYFGMAHILVRFMSIDSPAEVKGSRRIAMTWVVISLGAAAAIGLLGNLFVSMPEYAGAAEAVKADPEKIFLIMINTLFGGGVLSRVFAGVLLSSVLAAIMSTADSQLLVSASAFSSDIYKRAIRKNAGNRELVVVSRLTVFAVALAAILMASGGSPQTAAAEESQAAAEVADAGDAASVAAETAGTELAEIPAGQAAGTAEGEEPAEQEEEKKGGGFFEVVMKMVSFAWAGFGAAFGPAILLSLFWRRTTLAGTIAGMVVGTATVFLWKLLPSAELIAAHPIFGLYELAPGFLFALVAIVAVSLFTPAPSKEITDEFDRAVRETPPLQD